MPKREFFNLDKSKQEKIMNAARKEFTSMVYEEASINMIVKEAGISRGSFYCYFDNKKDIYMYVMVNEMRRIVDELVLPKKGKLNLYDASLGVFDQFVELYSVDTNKELMRNILVNLKLDFEKEMMDDFKGKVIKAVKKRIDLEGLVYTDAELFSIIGLVAHLILESIFLMVFKNVPYEEVRRDMQFRLLIIEKGLKGVR